MHATQPQGAASPEPHHTAPANQLVGLFTDDSRFRTWIARALATAAQPPATPEQPDLKAMSQEEFYRWSQGASPTGAPHSPCPDDGYAVTEPGRRALEEATTGEAPGTAAQVLRDAALYLSRHGWIQGAYYDATATSYTPAACMVGAIGMVCYGGPVEAPAQQFDDPGFLDFEEAVLHLDRYLLAEDGSESYEFNDAKGRRVDDITRVLRDAATRPAEELIDALRAIDQHNTGTAALSTMLIPDGTFAADARTTQHEGCAHVAGTLDGCPACEEQCFCNGTFPHRCVRCFGGLLDGRFRLSETGDVEPSSDGGDVG